MGGPPVPRILPAFQQMMRQNNKEFFHFPYPCLIDQEKKELYYLRTFEKSSAENDSIIPEATNVGQSALPYASDL